MIPTLLVEVYSRKLYQAELPRDGYQRKSALYKCFNVEHRTLTLRYRLQADIIYVHSMHVINQIHAAVMLWRN